MIYASVAACVPSFGFKAAPQQDRLFTRVATWFAREAAAAAGALAAGKSIDRSPEGTQVPSTGKTDGKTIVREPGFHDGLMGRSFGQRRERSRKSLAVPESYSKWSPN